MTSQTERISRSGFGRIRRCGPPPAKHAPLIWTRSQVIGLANATCTFCHGYGMLPMLRGAELPCRCVFRAIFRICHGRYRECESMAMHTNGVGIERVGGPTGYSLYSRKHQEYTADFCLVAHRILEPLDYEIFRLHYQGVADWRVCCRRLRLDRGTFFHRVYALTELLGRTFAELQPYPLYPVAAYFEGVVQSPDQPAATLDVDAEEPFVPGLFRWGGQRMTARRH
jgi:hypothetical protein